MRDKENKLTGAIITNNSGPPSMYVLWKDHKVDFETQLQTRPVVDGNSGPLSRISELLVIILSLFMSSGESSNTCKSTEEMLRAVQDCNKEIEFVDKDFTLLSMDIYSLYPNLCHDDVKEAVMELVMESQRELFVYDVRELCKYMAIILKEEEINEKGLFCYLPRRYNENTRKARPGMAYLETSTTKTKDRIKEKWV